MATGFNFDRSALLLVDLQRDLLHEEGALARAGLPAVGRDEVAHLLATYRELEVTMRDRGRPVVWITTAFRPDYMDNGVASVWLARRRAAAADFLIEGSWGAELMEGLAPESSDYTIVKKGHSAFADTNLDRLLTNLGVDRYILVGGAADDSIAETLRTGGRLGYEQLVVEDAIYPRRAVQAARLDRDADVVTLADLTSAAPLATPQRGEPGTAMVLVDMQNDFMKPNQPNRSTIIENTQDVMSAVRRHGWPVIYVYVLRREDNLDDAHPRIRTRQRVVDRSLGPGVTHCAIGTEGAEIVSELRPQPGDFLVDKQGGSGFGFTPLHRILRNLNVNRLLMTGGAASGCVWATALDGVALGYDITVVGDATYGGGSSTLDSLAQWCSVRPTAEVLRELS